MIVSSDFLEEGWSGEAMMETGVIDLTQFTKSDFDDSRLDTHPQSNFDCLFDILTNNTVYGFFQNSSDLNPTQGTPKWRANPSANKHPLFLYWLYNLYIFP